VNRANQIDNLLKQVTLVPGIKKSVCCFYRCAREAGQLKGKVCRTSIGIYISHFKWSCYIAILHFKWMC